MTALEKRETARHISEGEERARLALRIYKEKERTGRELEELKLLEGIAQSYEALRLFRAR